MRVHPALVQRTAHATLTAMSIAVTTYTWVARLFFRHFFRLLFLAVACAQWGCVAWFVWMGSDVTLPAWGHGLAVATIYGFNRALTGRRRSGSTAVPQMILRVYAATAFVSLFCFAFLVTSVACWVIGSGLAGAWSAAALSSGGQVVIDAHLSGPFRWFASTGMGAIALLFVYGYVVGQRQLRITRVRLGFAEGSVPGRIVQISDLHVGQNLTLDALRGFVRQVNALDADLICITGDIADSPLAAYEEFFPVLATLRARHGVCAVLGNHDHYAGAQRVVRELKRWTDFRVLRDQAVTLRLGETDLHVIGLDDRGRDWARGVGSDARLAQLAAQAPARTPIVLLSHRPDIFPQAVSAGVTLTLSGHTHGGQLALPWFGGARWNLAEFITPFSRGLYERDRCYLYVNCGLGVTGQPIRLFTPREITVIEARGACPET